MVRPARFGDIPRLVEIVEATHARSEYAHVELDGKALRSMLMQLVQRAPRFACLFVFERDGEVLGFVAGIVDRLYGISVAPIAQDLLLQVDERAPARAAGALVDAYTVWGREIPGVIEVQLGASSAGWQRVGKLYGRKGYRQTGGIYTQRIER